LVDATFQDAMVVIEMSKAAVLEMLIRVVAATSNRADHELVTLPIFIWCLGGSGRTAETTRLKVYKQAACLAGLDAV
jgi:hypothetical protein